MRNKRKFNFVALLVWVVLIGIGFWLYMQQKRTTPETPAIVLAPAKVAAPSLGKFAAPSAPAASSAAVGNINPTDPQSDLKTALPDLVSLIRAGDSLTRLRTYYPPEYLTAEFIQNEQQVELRFQLRLEKADSATQQKILQNRQQGTEDAAREIESLENQTPTFNEAGNEATYLYTPRAGGVPLDFQAPMTFIKINGKWYEKPLD